jgi:hypothetical protein
MLIGVYSRPSANSPKGRGICHTPGGMVQSLYLRALYGAMRGRRAVTPYERLDKGISTLMRRRGSGPYRSPSSMTLVLIECQYTAPEKKRESCFLLTR